MPLAACGGRMRQPSASRVLLVAVFLLALPVFAGPAEAGHTRVVAKGHFDEVGWVAFTLLLRDGTVIVRAGGPITSDHHAEGIVELDEAQRPISTKVTWTAPFAHASFRPGAPELSSRPPDSFDAPTAEAGAGIDSTYSGTGVRTFVLWVAGDYASWSYSVVVTPGVALLGLTSGTGAFLHEARDFEGPLHARALASATSIRANVGTTKAIDVENHLVGLFHASSRPGESVSVDTPESVRRDCPCWFFGPSDAHAGPGRYVFHLDGAHVSRNGDVVLTGADVVLPEI